MTETMIHVYLFVYSDRTGDRESMKNMLNSIPEIVNWRYDMPNSFYLQTEKSAQELTDIFVRKLNKNDKRFLISEITNNRQGYLPGDTWKFLNVEK